MSFDLSLVRNFSVLGLLARSNHIYSGQITAFITITSSFRRELHSNVVCSLIHNMVKELPTQYGTEEENQVNHYMNKLPTY